MLQRKTPLRSGGPLERTTRLRARSPRRSAAARAYYRDVAYYLARHPFCMIFIARHELDEDAVIAARGLPLVRGGTGVLFALAVPRSTEVHHRNKRNGDRLTDQRWWMAASREQHEWVENNKTDARALGYLLPIQADADGRWGDGNQALETAEFMKARVRP